MVARIRWIGIVGVALALALIAASCTTDVDDSETVPPPSPPPGPPPLAPAAPVLLSPPNGAADLDIPSPVTWGAISNATSYALQVSRNDKFTDVVYSVSGIVSTSQAVPGLVSGTTYWWRVNARNAVGVSGWTPARRFRTYVLVPPAAASPVNRVEDQSLAVTLGWNVAAHAEAYDLQVSTDSLFAVASRSLVNDSGLTATTRDVSGLARSTRYFWRLRTVQGTSRSPWSVPWSFRTLLTCDIASVEWGGETYATVSIGEQCWLQRNLDAGTMIVSGTPASDNGLPEKYCYDDDPASCADDGGLYSWHEGMQYIAAPGARGLCPDGWHIPTRADIATLSASVNDPGLSRFFVDDEDGGTNESGFSAMLSGYLDFGYFGEAGDVAKFWLSEETSGGGAYYWVIGQTGYGLVWSRADKNAGYSVRCVRD